MFDLQAKNVTASFDVGRGPDVLAYDPGLERLYVASESGVVSVFATGAGRVAEIGKTMPGANAHVVGVDPETHQVFFPLKNEHGRTLLRIMRPQNAPKDPR